MSSDSPGSNSVIIIDPSRVTRLIVEYSLRRVDIPCAGFADTSSALQALQADAEWVPRVVVLELAFPAPGIDGYALIRLLRSSARLDQTAIVVLTAKRGVIDHLRARLAGANDILVKPFKQKHFLAVIAGYCAPRREQVPRAAIGDEHHDPIVHPGSAERGARAS